ncbi:response regulator [Chitinophaga agrisoli]|uniref:Response regulator n=1 Tax=Chitinophaga agrisoli TaxID=2607653 RepID=A0A5B2VYM4_9BACT|nr:response regulator [Chitinophaga agrisoli]KAA2243286.1 response regulator [Chitinophaga agrisoli]
MKSGPIIIIEDDADDKAIMEDIIRDLNVRNQLIWFSNCDDAWQYLKVTTEQPFIIFSDVNMPRQSGIEFKKQIDTDEHLRKKSIPFIFYSTAVNQQAVNKAYTEMTVQGFFQKHSTYDTMKNDLKLIIDYWTVCRHPNTI